jgi:hypothetical protein
MLKLLQNRLTKLRLWLQKSRIFNSIITYIFFNRTLMNFSIKTLLITLYISLIFPQIIPLNNSLNNFL